MCNVMFMDLRPRYDRHREYGNQATAQLKQMCPVRAVGPKVSEPAAWSRAG